MPSDLTQGIMLNKTSADKSRYCRVNRPRSCGAEKFSSGPSGTMRVGLIAVMLMIIALGYLVNRLVFRTMERTLQSRWGLTPTA